MLAKDLGQSLGKGCTQFRVAQHKEPDHFLSHFEPNFRVRLGSRSQHKDRLASSIVYHIRGIDKSNIKAFEVVHPTLNSRDCFVLSIPNKKSFIWEGSISSEHCKAVAKKVSQNYEHDFQILKEGQETGNLNF